MSNETEHSQRPRQHPEERFQPPTRLIDVAEQATQMRAEPSDGPPRHRQMALHKDGGLTIALFLFPPGTGLPEHRARGIVNMHVLRGQLNITAGGQPHTLTAGQMLLLAPGVPHAVTANEDSEMLVTVSLSQP